ncbi:uncharacterized protein EI90DRAFT_2360166 [Cantharellus anzutake]|uniref:uncharacterized protein n=1 Tax=Cantharellus anzutake TaxID=1750568 RepID=UPI001902FB59|nr:uncharacterized protein EI90DRAFT_2360166 [Cantharellus anzutake]KAF8324350.1 hypothetical protein EI90DRAFT_2360166 [Cantharellus anzutake]
MRLWSAFTPITLLPVVTAGFLVGQMTFDQTQPLGQMTPNQTQPLGQMTPNQTRSFVAIVPSFGSSYEGR